MSKRHFVPRRALAAGVALTTSVALAAGTTVAQAAPDASGQTNSFRKAGKAKNIGRVEVPQEAFVSALRLED